MSDVAVVILAGGDGRRIGGGKPLRLLGGERLIDRALLLARSWSNHVAVAVRQPTQLGQLNTELIVDAPDVEGPLGGLIVGLKWAQAGKQRFLLTIAADMPFLPSDLAGRLADAIGEQGCAMASSGGHLHPVCALWRCDALDDADDYVATGQRSVIGFAEAIGLKQVEWTAEAEDPFFNINDERGLTDAGHRLAR